MQWVAAVVIATVWIKGRWVQSVQRVGVRLGLAMGAALGGRLQNGDRIMDPMLAALVRYVRRARPVPPPLLALRRQYEDGLQLMGMTADPRAPGIAVAGHGLTGRLYEPPGPVRLGMVYFHGGGFMMGSTATHDAICRRLAVAGLRVLSIDYRLAPEHQFPAAHDDAQAALAWGREILGGRLAVGGDSAGANLAAGLGREPGVVLQFLLYPVVDMVEDRVRYPSLTRFGTGFLLTEDGLQSCAALLLPNGTDRADPRLSPIRGVLEGAAPAVICVAGFDPLYDHGVAHAAALRAAGVPVVLLEENGMIHGFADFAGLIPSARLAVERTVAALVAALPGHA